MSGWPAPVAHVAIQGYVQASAGQGFVVNLSRNPRFIQGLEAFGLVLEVDGVRTAFRPELCALRGEGAPEWKLDGHFSGNPLLTIGSVPAISKLINLALGATDLMGDLSGCANQVVRLGIYQAQFNPNCNPQ